MNHREARDEEIIRDLLVRIDGSEGISQRDLSRELGIALGLTNAYIRRCVKKGLLKISQAPARRYRYYLTPKGFAEKTRLTAQYFHDSLVFFRRARNQLSAIFEECQAHGWRRVGLYGQSELSEIALLCAGDYGVAVAAVVDPQRKGGRVAGLPVVPDLAALGEVDALVVTDLKNPQGSFEALAASLGPERVFTPGVLHVARARNGEGRERAAGARARG